jgi:hypothetical protein
MKISVIIGAPGTGKTRTIGEWASRAATRYGMDRVMVCSLTRAGAKEASRDVTLPYSQLGTVHSFAHRALGSPIVAESKITEFNEAYPAFALGGHDLTADESYNDPGEDTDADRAKLEVSRYRTLGVPMAQWEKDSTRDFAQRWETWKQACGYMDFTDLIEQAYENCETAPGNPAVILGDEWQDAGLAETRLIMKWAEHAEHLVLTGDSQQAIYQWRGTDPLLLQRMWLEHDSGRQPLQQSYRLSKSVYEYAYAWAQRFTRTIPIAFVPRDVEGYVSRGTLCFATMTARDVENLVNRYVAYSPDTLMFQATCGYLLDPVIAALREAGIPFHNPSRPNHGKWNPLPQKRSKGNTVIDRVLAFLRPCEEVWGEHARFWTPGDVKAWAGGLPAKGIFKRGMGKGLDTLPDGTLDENVVRALQHCLEPDALAHIAPTPDIGWYLGHISKGSVQFRTYVTEVIARHGAAILREKPKVVVGTVHSTKGAEATTVVLAPDMSMQAYEGARKSEEAAEELRRVFYVAITRSRDRLLLCQPSGRTHVTW